jgi:hypothetical protein
MEFILRIYGEKVYVISRFRAQADWTFILESRISCERAAPLAEKNAALRHHVLRSLISLHIEHRV